MPGFELAERTLERGDLAAKLLTTRSLGIDGMPRTGGRDVERGGDGARVHPGVMGFAGGIGGDGVHDGRRPQGSVGDEGARALATDEHALVLEALVDGAHGVGVDVQSLGEVAQPGQALAGRKSAVADAGAQRPGKLHTEGNLGAAVKNEVLKQSLGRL